MKLSRTSELNIKHAIQNATVSYVNSTTAGPTSTSTDSNVQGCTQPAKCTLSNNPKDTPEKTETQQFSLISFFSKQFCLILTRSRRIPLASSSVYQNHPKFKGNPSCRRSFLAQSTIPLALGKGEKQRIGGINRLRSALQETEHANNVKRQL